MINTRNLESYKKELYHECMLRITRFSILADKDISQMLTKLNNAKTLDDVDLVFRQITQEEAEHNIFDDQKLCDRQNDFISTNTYLTLYASESEFTSWVSDQKKLISNIANISTEKVDQILYKFWQIQEEKNHTLGSRIAIIYAIKCCVLGYNVLF